MSKRKETTTAPEPLEEYVRPFDSLFEKWNQRESFRCYLEGLLLPTERNKTLTGLANTEPVVGAQDRQAQFLQWFLCESDWDERTVQNQRLQMLLSDPLTVPSEHGVLVIDEHGDRKAGTHMAHVGRQYLGNLGKVDNGVVSVTSLWADEGIYYPVDFEPYTPAHHYEKGEKDPGFRTKLKIALQLVNRAMEVGIPFRAVVADSFYGEDYSLRQELRALQKAYVLALKPSHNWWHAEATLGSLQEVAQAAGWKRADQPGQWVKVERTFRDGSKQTWWALQVKAGPYGPDKTERAVIATTDPATLPDTSTWYLVTNLPAPGSPTAEQSPLVAASLEEVIRLYGLRMWIEQSRHSGQRNLGMVAVPSSKRSSHPAALATGLLCLLLLLVPPQPLSRLLRFGWKTSGWCQTTGQQEQAPEDISAGGEKNERLRGRSTLSLLAKSPAKGESMVGAVDSAAALLAGVVRTASTSCASTVT